MRGLHQVVCNVSKSGADVECLHRKTWHQFNLFRPPWTCGQYERKVYLWCMHCEHCGFCLTTVECPMRGRILAHEDVWLYCKWKTEVDVDSLVQATLPPSHVEDEVDTYEALVLASRVKGNVKAPPQTPQSTSSSSPPHK